MRLIFPVLLGLLLVGAGCVEVDVAGVQGTGDQVGADQHPANQPPQEKSVPAGETQKELGLVEWGRDLDAAKQRSAATGNPLFVLFQEVPGCQTCQDFGSGPLSHPLMVEAIEELFIPVLVYNNKPTDEAILKSFDEPSWNNPVVRFVDARGDDLIPRADGVWSIESLALRMRDSLQTAGRQVPNWFTAVTSGKPDKATPATFAMHCYWEGEARLGALDGVLSTRSAWIGEKEVVQLTYDPAVIGYDELLKTAASMECASTVYTHNEQQFETATATVGKEIVEPVDKGTVVRDAKPSDQKYALANSPYRFLPLTELQAVKLNAAVHADDMALAESWLSPRQLELQKRIVARLESKPQLLDELQPPDQDTDLAIYSRQLQETLQRP